MRIRSALFVAALAAALSAPMAMTTTAQAAPVRDRDDIEIDFVYYNPPGPDIDTPRRLNGEYVRIENNGYRGQNLSGWTLWSSDGFVYRFRPGTWVAGGRSITVHTGPGADRWNRVFADLDDHIYDNDRGRVWLRDRRGTVDTCSWRSRWPGYTDCDEWDYRGGRGRR